MAAGGQGSRYSAHRSGGQLRVGARAACPDPAATVTPVTVIGTCESCASEDEVVVRVQRYYVTPEQWDTPGKVEEGEVEQWCFACRTHYPHVLLDGDDPADSAAGPSDASG
jgi:hypothetical protein